jgi:hypothetical protein
MFYHQELVLDVHLLSLLYVYNSKQRYVLVGIVLRIYKCNVMYVYEN